jgi:hypothetical protein
MKYQLSKNILATVAYYDAMDFPLTAFEIWKHLIAHDRDAKEDQSCRLGEVVAALAASRRPERIVELDGFYCLAGRESLVADRIRMEKISSGKLRRLRGLSRFIACIPFVHMFGAAGSLSMKHAGAGSDWDVFVVLRSGRIWIGRTLLTGLLHLIGKRRHGDKVNDRVCLNYFVTDDNLKIGMKDLFSAHEYRFLVPLYNFRLFQVFELKNAWIKEYKPNFRLTVLPSLWTADISPRLLGYKTFLERILQFPSLEKRLASWQKGKIARNPKTHLEGSMIEAHDRALIFLPKPRGPQVFERFKKRLGA